jgi:hypothetical protein
VVQSLELLKGSVVQILVDHHDLKQREAGTGFVITKPNVDIIVSEGDKLGVFNWKEMDCNPFIVLTARRLLGPKPVPSNITIRFFYDQPISKNPTKIEDCECSGCVSKFMRFFFFFRFLRRDEAAREFVFCSLPVSWVVVVLSFIVKSTIHVNSYPV